MGLILFFTLCVSHLIWLDCATECRFTVLVKHLKSILLFIAPLVCLKILILTVKDSLISFSAEYIFIQSKIYINRKHSTIFRVKIHSISCIIVAVYTEKKTFSYVHCTHTQITNSWLSKVSFDLTIWIYFRYWFPSNRLCDCLHRWN